MARYSLILRDKTYVVLLQEAARHGKTIGKFLNEILDAKALELEVGKKQDSLNPHCMTCKFYRQKTSWCINKGEKVRANGTCQFYVRG